MLGHPIPRAQCKEQGQKHPERNHEPPPGEGSQCNRGTPQLRKLPTRGSQVADPVRQVADPSPSFQPEAKLLTHTLLGVLSAGLLGLISSERGVLPT